MSLECWIWKLMANARGMVHPRFLWVVCGLVVLAKMEMIFWIWICIVDATLLASQRFG